MVLTEAMAAGAAGAGQRPGRVPRGARRRAPGRCSRTGDADALAATLGRAAGRPGPAGRARRGRAARSAAFDWPVVAAAVARVYRAAVARRPAARRGAGRPAVDAAWGVAVPGRRAASLVLGWPVLGGWPAAAAGPAARRTDAARAGLRRRAGAAGRGRAGCRPPPAARPGAALPAAAAGRPAAGGRAAGPPTARTRGRRGERRSAGRWPALDRHRLPDAGRAPSWPRPSSCWCWPGSVHNDAVRDTLVLRSRRLVRWLRLAGTAPAARLLRDRRRRRPSGRRRRPEDLGGSAGRRPR